MSNAEAEMTDAIPPEVQNTDAPITGPDSPPPVPLAPGRLATRLQQVFTNALAHTVKTCSYANFAACFPTPAARRPDVLQSVWQQIVGKIESKARTEFDGIMGERDVTRGLNELEALLADARRRRDKWESEGGDKGTLPVPPHALPPEELYRAHLAPELEPLQAQLHAKIEATSKENEELAEGISSQKTEIEALIGQLEAVVKDLEGANEVLGSVVEDENLRQEVAEIQKELSDSKL